jgi:hypothetical protein
LAVAGAGRVETKLAAKELNRCSRLLDITFTETRAASSSSTAVVAWCARMKPPDYFFKSAGLDFKVCKELGAKLDAGRFERA